MITSLSDMLSLFRQCEKHAKTREKKTGEIRPGKIEIVTGATQLETAIEADDNVYSTSRKQPEPYPYVVSELIRTCAAMGALRLGSIHEDGDPAAAQFWIVKNGKAMIQKPAQDESLPIFPSERF